MTYKYKPAPDCLVIKADLSEKYSAGGIIISAAPSREAQAPDKVEVIRLGAGAFNHWDEPKPKEGDTVVIARYDGVTIEKVEEGDKTYEYRVILDTRIRALEEQAHE